MISEATLKIETNVGGPVLYMAMELSQRIWKLLFATTAGGRRERSVPARDLSKLFAEIAAAKRRFGLGPQARVVSCYEAGRDGSIAPCARTGSRTWSWIPPRSRSRAGRGAARPTGSTSSS
jgi:hypothetical protein